MESRWSQEARQFLVALAQAKSREAPPPLQGCVKAAWLHRWSCLLACTAARSFALSLVDGLAPGVSGPTPCATCERIFCFVGLTVTSLHSSSTPKKKKTFHGSAATMRQLLLSLFQNWTFATLASLPSVSQVGDPQPPLAPAPPAPCPTTAFQLLRTSPVPRLSGAHLTHLSAHLSTRGSSNQGSSHGTRCCLPTSFTPGAHCTFTPEPFRLKPTTSLRRFGGRFCVSWPAGKQRERERSRIRGSISRETRLPRPSLACQSSIGHFCCSAGFQTEESRRSRCPQLGTDRQTGAGHCRSRRAAGLIATLKKVRAQSIQPIGERLDACQQFVERARKRLVAAEDVVVKALQTKSRLECELTEGVQRLQRLREEAAAQPRAPTAEHGEVPPIATAERGEVPPIAPEAQAVEVNQLRATIEDLQRERDRLRSEVSRQRTEESRPLEQSVIDRGDMLSREPVQSSGVIRDARGVAASQGFHSANKVGQVIHLDPSS